MASQEFDEAVAAATAEASGSRKQLGCNYAIEFRQNPDWFDPRKLIALGREGLSSFAASMKLPTRGLELPNEPPVEARDPNDVDGGWTGKQMVPLPFEISAFLLGSMGGIGVIFGCALLFTH
ncbi:MULTISPECIES: hypothetical protein [Pseudomonadota]|uniref:hypothetical protein n=1 Tax=Pseudomonadota TaxID=1224 RepID=UPI00070A790A|nr:MULTISPECIES: hypothetical protein [Pseudomonadota]KQT12886.1 hypothetical protein ASG57_08005 [Bradyrhizobium sp. Leaf396]MBY9051399.1 hypothetical protein [Pseudomonas fluorescens]